MENQIDMKDLVREGKAKILTIEGAKALIGKKIKTFYFGYNGQNGQDEFEIGKIEREIYQNGKEGEITIFDSTGRNTYIRSHKENAGAFSCSDSDRFVFFIEIFGKEYLKIHHYYCIQTDKGVFNLRFICFSSDKAKFIGYKTSCVISIPINELKIYSCNLFDKIESL